MTFKTDTEAHMRATKRFYASIVIVLACWTGCWYVSWQAALLGMLANAYMVGAFAFAVYSVPSKEES